LKAGDIVTISGSPSRREPEKLMLGRDLTKQSDNSYVPLNIASRSSLRDQDTTPWPRALPGRGSRQ
jgi:hypothetical protein